MRFYFSYRVLKKWVAAGICLRNVKIQADDNSNCNGKGIIKTLHRCLLQHAFIFRLRMFHITSMVIRTSWRFELLWRRYNLYRYVMTPKLQSRLYFLRCLQPPTSCSKASPRLDHSLLLVIARYMLWLQSRLEDFCMELHYQKNLVPTTFLCLVLLLFLQRSTVFPGPNDQ